MKKAENILHKQFGSCRHSLKNLRKEYDLSFEEFVNLDNINLKQKLIDINYFVIFIDDLFNSSENYFKIKKFKLQTSIKIY